MEAVVSTAFAQEFLDRDLQRGAYVLFHDDAPETVLFMIARAVGPSPVPLYSDLVQKWRAGEMLPLALHPPSAVTKAPSRTNATFRPLGPKIGDANGQ